MSLSAYREPLRRQGGSFISCQRRTNERTTSSATVIKSKIAQEIDWPYRNSPDQIASNRQWQWHWHRRNGHMLSSCWAFTFKGKRYQKQPRDNKDRNRSSNYVSFMSNYQRDETLQWIWRKRHICCCPMVFVMVVALPKRCLSARPLLYGMLLLLLFLLWLNVSSCFSFVVFALLLRIFLARFAF